MAQKIRISIKERTLMLRARKKKYFNEIRRNNSKQSPYYVKFTENEKNTEKNLLQIIDFL